MSSKPNTVRMIMLARDVGREYKLKHLFAPLTLDTCLIRITHT